MDKLHNNIRHRRKATIIFIALLVFMCLMIPGVAPSISALGPVQENIGGQDIPPSDLQSLDNKEASGGDGMTSSALNTEDYLDETSLRHCIKSVLANRAKNKLAIKLPEPTAKAVFNANIVGKVALSFDDGPYDQLTEEYIEVLKKYDVEATFFLVGNRVERFPELAEKIAKTGFDIGSHSYAHAQLTKRNPPWIVKDLEKTKASIKKASGVDVKLFRPPYGDCNQAVLKAAMAQDLITVKWNVDPKDWQVDDPAKIVENILTNSTDGSIILMHEGRESTLEALPQIISGLRAKGFEIVSVAELLSAEEQGKEENI